MQTVKHCPLQSVDDHCSLTTNKLFTYYRQVEKSQQCQHSASTTCRHAARTAATLVARLGSRACTCACRSRMLRRGLLQDGRAQGSRRVHGSQRVNYTGMPPQKYQHPVTCSMQECLATSIRLSHCA